ncbi:MAG: transcription termination/antitermination protein NusG, partial [Planctomycetaceae bacterium]
MLEISFARNLTDAAGAALWAEPRWYACYTRSRHEKQVDRLLQQRGIESYLPVVPRVRQWKDRKKLVTWPLFPSYVFGWFALNDLHQVLSTPGVATVVRANGQPVPIAAEDVENVRRFAAVLAEQDVELDVRPFLVEGQWVEVMEGPFVGIRGVVIERRNRRRVLVGLEAIGQGLEIDVDTRSLRP